MIPGQMTIYDFLVADADYPNINDIEEAEAVRIVGDAIGVCFKYNDYFGEWQAKINKSTTLGIHYSNYVLDDNKDRFLACGFSYKQGGAGAPCDDIRSAVEWFNEIIRGGEQ